MTHPLGDVFLSEQADEIKKEKEIELNNNINKQYQHIENLYNMNPEIHTQILIDEARRYTKNNDRKWLFFMDDLIDSGLCVNNIRKILSGSYIFTKEGPIAMSELNIHCLKKRMRYENNISYLRNRKLLFFDKKNEFIET